MVAGDGRLGARLGLRWHADVDGFFAQLEAARAPRRLIIDATQLHETSDRAEALHREAGWALQLLQRFLSDARLEGSEETGVGDGFGGRMSR